MWAVFVLVAALLAVAGGKVAKCDCSKCRPLTKTNCSVRVWTDGRVDCNWQSIKSGCVGGKTDCKAGAKAFDCSSPDYTGASISQCELLCISNSCQKYTK